MVVPLNRFAVLFSIIGGIFVHPAVSDSGNSFSMPAILNEKYVHNPLRYVKRTNISPTAYLNGGIYTTPVVIGGSQTLNMHFDTGSGDMWVFSTYLDPSQWGTHNIFDPAKSTTFNLIDGSSIKETYGDGNTISGKVGSDSVTIGAISSPTQIFGVPDTISPGLLQMSCDGLIGLAFEASSDISPNPAAPFFTNVLGSLDSPVFAVYLPINANGFYDFGTLPPSRYTGTIQYAAVDNSEGYWQFNSASFKVGDQIYQSPGTVAIADIGTELILMQFNQAAKFYSAVSGAERGTDDQWTFPCNSDLPTLGLMIGATEYAIIPAKYLIWKAKDNTRTTCIGSLQETDTSFNVYGLPLLYAYYGVFDYSVPQFGFAPCAGC